VVDGAQREAVDDRGDALLVRVLDDVRGLDQRGLAQRADRAAAAVGAQHVEPEAVLVQAGADLAHRVGAVVGGALQALVLEVGDRKADLERDDARDGVVARDEDGLEDHVLARCEAVEVDERHLLGERCAQRSVIGLVDGAGSVVVDDRPRGGVELVVVGAWLARHRRGGGQRERCGADLPARAVDAALERAEADAVAPKLEAAPQLGQGHDVVVALREAPGGVVGRQAERVVGVIHRCTASRRWRENASSEGENPGAGRLDGHAAPRRGGLR